MAPCASLAAETSSSTNCSVARWTMPMRALLLVALYRLETRPEMAHTVVDQAVNAAGGLAAGKMRGLTNGVLRNFCGGRRPCWRRPIGTRSPRIGIRNGGAALAGILSRAVGPSSLQATSLLRWPCG